MSFLTSKKTLIAVGVGIVSIVGLATLGYRTVSQQIEKAFGLLSDDFIQFDDDIVSNDVSFDEGVEVEIIKLTPIQI